MELASNQGSCGGIFSNANIFNDMPLHEPRLQASSSPTVRIRILSISFKQLVHIQHTLTYINVVLHNVFLTLQTWIVIEVKSH